MRCISISYCQVLPENNYFITIFGLEFRSISITMDNNNKPGTGEKLNGLAGECQCQERAYFVDQKILGIDLRECQENSFIKLVAAESKKEKSPNPLHHKTDEEKVKLVKEMFNWSFPGLGRLEILKKYQKDCESSKLLRDHGNRLFRQKNFTEALHFYNIALLFGLDDSLGLAYANRSAVLLELGDPTGALEDIDLALKHNYPASQAQKLEQRKLKCIQMIENTASEDAKIKSLMDEELFRLSKVRNSFSHIEKRNPRAPAAAKCVKIKFDHTYGRQLIVKSDVAIGTLLLVENPYVCVLKDQLNWNTEHCHHCFKRFRRGIPCEKCVFAYYCSQVCLKKSLESAHRFECSLLPHLHLNRTSDHTYQALKVICKVGSAELYHLFTSRDPAFFNRKQAFGTAKKDIYESDSYLPVFHLQSHPECFGFVEQCTQIHQALLITEYLDAETDFFEKIPMDRKNPFKEFVAAMMVRHIQSGMVNSATLIQVGEEEDFALESYLRLVVKGGRVRPHGCKCRHSDQDVASGIYPLLSLINHSCAPNAFYINRGTNGTMAVVAMKRLRKGEQIRISYTLTFAGSERKDRQAKLRLYNFDCKCIACRNDWPKWDMFARPNNRYCCPACSKKFSNEEKDSGEFLQCELKWPWWKCLRCGKRYIGTELQKQRSLIEELYVEVDALVCSWKHWKQMPIIIKVLDYHQLNLMPPGEMTYVFGCFLRILLAFMLQVLY